ncbi:PepSY-associated TM helix domain-containing protein [Silvibacterium dinghuense]|uniref:PepSY-associated TM helix domain-containing protein n=1 Tax=Silvibacterium dinghuense TaxID=1560006 RepID=UPI001E3C9767|nr:PepSY-associated TM helix domain-containing protein [Silvibacterium dinghuense]
MHLWAGILFSLYICAIGISGSILVFHDELMPRPHFTGSPPGTPCTPTSLVTALQAAEHLHPHFMPQLASCPTDADRFYQINLQASGQPAVTLYVDPATDQVAGEEDQDATWIGFVERFHIDLLLRKNGRQWNGLGAGILLALAVTGLFLWWPGIRNWARALKVNFSLNWKRINFDLHSAVGFWTILFSLTWALTGIYFAWETPFERAISLLSPMTTARYPAEDIARFQARFSSAEPATFDLTSTLERAVSDSHPARLEGFFYGSGRAPIFTVYMARGAMGDYANTDFVYFDQSSGNLFLNWHRGQNHTLGDWLLWLAVPLHFGTSFGMLGKILWATAGLAFPALAMTGILMYWNRCLSKWRKALNAA